MDEKEPDMILHISAFIDSEKRHGGTKRSDQIRELLLPCNALTIAFGNNIRTCLIAAIKNPIVFFELFLFSIYTFVFYGCSLKGLFKLSLYCLPVCEEIRKQDYSLVILETAPSVSITFMHYLAWKNIKYCVFPHNIEHMVPDQVVGDFRSLSYLFKTEISGYAKASIVYVISDLDKAILSCYGITAQVLQYFPSEKDRLQFSKIKKIRNSSAKKSGYLLLGTVGNAPTLNGMKEIIESYCGDEVLYVAGYGAEVFDGYATDKIHVLGALNDDELVSLMSTVKALLINQPQTTGFLTKIIEFNLSGLPVVVTSDYFQAKNLSDYGVFCVPADKLSLFSLKSEAQRFKEFRTQDDVFLSGMK